MTAPPTVAVIVASRDRPAALAACLRSLGALELPPGGAELVVVDDASRAPVDGALLDLASALSPRLIRRQSPGGPGIARNDGAAAARARWLAFVDDDCTVDPGWLVALVAALASEPGCGAGGRTIAADPRNRWMAASAELEQVVYEHENHDRAHARFLTSKNLAFPAAEFAEMEGFEPGLWISEDRDFCTRWREAGRRLLYVPEAVVAHDHPRTARAFLAQHFGYGRGSYAFHVARLRRGGPGLRPDLRFYAKVLAHPWRAPGGRRGERCALLAVSQLVTAAGYLSAALNARRATAPATRAARSSPAPAPAAAPARPTAAAVRGSEPA